MGVRLCRRTHCRLFVPFGRKGETLHAFDPWHVVGLLATIALIIGVGIYSGRKVRSAADFASGGGKAGAWIVCGAIMGTLVSGQATIGTAQLAFNYGMSAWWFTLGSGIGCLILALGYAAPPAAQWVLHLAADRLPGSTAPGRRLGGVCSAPSASSSAWWPRSLCHGAAHHHFPRQPFGGGLDLHPPHGGVRHVRRGVWGAGMGGVVKLILLYVSAIAGGVLVYGLWPTASGGVLETVEHLLVNSPLGTLSGVESQQAVHERFTSLIARGASKDIGSGLSLVLGVLSTQTYAQAIWSGKSDRAAKKGALLSACLIPPIGIACILIGLYMRGHCITADEVAALQAVGQSVPEGLIQIESTSQVFPVFVAQFMPALFGGVVLGTLFITVVGGGSGLALGMASILVTDIFSRKSARVKGTPAPTSW